MNDPPAKESWLVLGDMLSRQYLFHRRQVNALFDWKRAVLPVVLIYLCHADQKNTRWDRLISDKDSRGNTSLCFQVIGCIGHRHSKGRPIEMGQPITSRRISVRTKQALGNKL